MHSLLDTNRWNFAAGDKDVWLADVADTDHLKADQLQFLLEGGAPRKRKSRSKPVASRGAASSSSRTAKRRDSVGSGCDSDVCLEVFFDSGSGSESASESDHDGPWWC